MLVNHPGSWQQFQFRSDNRGLSVMEMKSKYLHEQYLFEAQMENLNQIHQQNTFMNGGGGGPAPTPSEPVIPDTLIQFYFTNIQDAINEFGEGILSLTFWNDSFGAIFTYINVNENDSLITIGGASDIAFPLDLFSGYTSMIRIVDVNSNTVTSIGSNAFDGSALVTFIGDAVTSIGDGAFANCADLNEVWFRAEGCNYGTNVFLNAGTGGTANVNTDATLNANILYLQNTLNWTIVS